MYYLYNKTTEIRPNRAWKDVNGIQHPANWHIWSADYKASMNIEEIVLDAKPDGRFYKWIDNGLSGISNKTARSLDDYNEQTQSKNSDGKFIFLDSDGKEVLEDDHEKDKKYTAKMEDKKDSDGNVVKGRGIRPDYIKKVKDQQGSLLAQTDWAVVRKADTGVAVPTKIATYRAAIRNKATAMEKAITDASDMDAFKALFLVWDGEGNKSGILFDWPELEE
jgi:hypothetical protein